MIHRAALALLVVFAAPQARAQECLTGLHRFQAGTCVTTFINSCGRPIHCTLQAEGVLANGTRVQDGRAQVIENGGSVSLSISGVARCGSFDA